MSKIRSRIFLQSSRVINIDGKSNVTELKPLLQEREVALPSPSQPHLRPLRPLGVHRGLVRGRRSGLQPRLEGPGMEFETLLIG